MAGPGTAPTERLGAARASCPGRHSRSQAAQTCPPAFLALSPQTGSLRRDAHATQSRRPPPAPHSPAFAAGLFIPRWTTNPQTLLLLQRISCRHGTELPARSNGQSLFLFLSLSSPFSVVLFLRALGVLGGFLLRVSLCSLWLALLDCGSAALCSARFRRAVPQRFCTSSSRRIALQSRTC